MMELLGTKNAALEFQGYCIAAIMLATLVWALSPALQKRTA
jgi:hypothetical protein